MDEHVLKALAAEMRAYVDARLKELPPPVAGERGAAGEPGPSGPAGDRGPEGVPGRDGRDALPMPGPQGLPGEKGIDGRDGKDGRDGITLEQLKSEIAEMRKSLIEEMAASLDFDYEARQWKALGRTWLFPYPLNKGVYQQGIVYERGHQVTWGGSSWECIGEKATEPPQESSKMWRLVVKAGRNGKDRT